MKKFGLIGNPISTSKSPALFEAGYHGRYRYDLIENSDFEAAYAAFIDGYEGINVTAPFKLDAFARADAKSGTCATIGAANLLLKGNDGISAWNTDYYGIILSILDAVFPDDGGAGYFRIHGLDFAPAGEILKKYHGHIPAALIAGCGGAGRAAAVAAASLGYRTTLMNRSVEKAVRIMSDIPEYGFGIANIENFREVFKESDLVIYTIPGSIPELENMPVGYYGGQGKIVLEANYKNPSFTPEKILSLAENGGTYVSGKRWLLYQALTGFRIFTGENPDFGEMCKVI